MTITGNIKCFELSKALFKNGASVVASTGRATEDNIIDFNDLTKWQSVGSDDSTAETLLVTFDGPLDISRLFLLNHNFKSFTVVPVTDRNILDNFGSDILDDADDEIEDDGVQQLEFQNVISSLSSTPVAGISETGWGLPSSYHEFDTFYCLGLLITVTEAQATIGALVNQEKYLYRCIPTIEVNSNSGTFQSFPELQRPTDYNGISTKILNGKFKISKQTPVFGALLSLANNNVQNDIELMEFLRYMQDDFLIWPNGGKPTEDFFRFDASPYKTDDIYQCQVISSQMAQYLFNIYSNITRSSIGLVETI